jgi:DNA processing protein
MSDPALQETLELAVTLGHRTRGVGDLLREGVTPRALRQAQPALLERLPRGPALALAAGRDDLQAGVDRLAAALAACGAACLPFDDPRYPDALRQIPDPPPWLFYRGDPALLAGPAIAVVGSRRASHAGRQLATLFSSRQAAAGYVICSGMARGIDAAAHRGALQSGTTIAVLGTGIDECYPRSHAPLLRDIAERGCLISELAPGTAVHRGQFPRRNRIISGLAVGTVIVEAALPSGSLHTAAAALEQGRDVYVMPWSLLHRGGAGCLHLLRDGATPLTCLDELEDYFPLLASPADGETDPDAMLLELLGDAELGLQALADGSGLAAGELMAAMGRLEAAGRVRRSAGGYSCTHCKSCVGPGSC